MPIIGVYSGQQRGQPNGYYDFYVCLLVVIAMRFGGPHMFTDWRKNRIVGYFFLLLVLINLVIVSSYLMSFYIGVWSYVGKFVRNLKVGVSVGVY